MPRKRGTLPGDVVLIHYQGRPASFARVEDLRSHPRPGWFFCDLLVLAVPVQAVTWILEREQIDGADFTMGGEPVRLERLPDVGSVHEKRRAAEPAESALRDAAAPGSGSDAEGGASPPRTAERPQTAREGNVVQLFPRKSAEPR
jgi:hypothetical protein